MSFQNYLQTLLVIALVSIVSACGKDKPVPIDYGDCYNFNTRYPDLGTITTFSSGKIQYRTPCYNPNNANEFIYHYRNYVSDEYQLLKYNLQTKEKTLVLNSGLIGQPKWSRMGSIAYTHFDPYAGHLFVIKDDGGDLIQFSENISNIYPAWNDSGSKLFWTYSPVLGIPYYFLSQPQNQNLSPDTILRNGDEYSGYAGYNDVSTNNQLVSFAYLENKGGLAVSNLNDSIFQFTKVLNLESSFSYPEPSGLCWSHDGTHLYTTILGGLMAGLYRVELNGSFEKLISFCDSKKYKTISASPDGKYLVAERQDSFWDLGASGNIIRNSSIYLINLATLEEIKVDLE